MKNKIINDDFISQLEAIILTMKGPMKGFFGGNHRTDTYGSTIEFADFREYVLGDDIRHVDWNLYSRFEKYFIKLFVDERQMHNQIFIDCSSSMNFGSPKKSQAALKVAAALGYLSIHNMDKISYKMIKKDKIEDSNGIVCGKDAFYRSLDVLENTNFENDVDINRAITTCYDVGNNDGLTVIISDFLTDSNWKNAIDYLLYKHREVMLVQVLSPEEIHPPYNGRIILLDSESGDKLDDKNLKMKISKSEYEAYLEAYENYVLDIKNFCQARNVSYLFLKSDDNIEKVFFSRLFEMGVIK